MTWSFSNIVLGLLLFYTFVQVIYYIFPFSTFLFKNAAHKKEPKSKTDEGVSIIICAYNELENLKTNLPSILTQDYPILEILIVDDASTDGSSTYLKQLEKEQPQLNVLFLKERDRSVNPGKKYALSKGIKAAKYELLLLTDADCIASSDQWCANMVAMLPTHKDLLLAYGPYFKDNSWLNAFIRFETVLTAMQYFSWASIGLAYMGVGRNILYRKQIFEQNNGFQNHKHIASGDDDLFIRDSSNTSNTSWTIDANTFMYSEPKRTWFSFFKQKQRHVSTSTHYKWQHQLILGFFSFSFIIHYLSLVLLLIFADSNLYYAIITYLIRQITIFTVFRQYFKLLEAKDLIWKLPFLDFFLFIYYIILTPTLSFGNKNKWT